MASDLAQHARRLALPEQSPPDLTPTDAGEPPTVLLFGGSFDPPHAGHAKLPPLVRDAIGARWVVYIPAARSPHKDDGPAAGEDERLDMLRLALNGTPRCSISTIELDRARDTPGEPSYTARTVEALHELFDGAVRFRWLIGADQARSFHRWREPERIIDLAEPVVMLRRTGSASNGGPAPTDGPTPTGSVDERAALLAELERQWGAEGASDWAERIVAVDTVDASATEVRELLAHHGPHDRPPHVRARLLEMLPPSVLRYIDARELYFDEASAQGQHAAAHPPG
jgi:nicotinate-nucleotide adenylyltransferase